MTSPVVASQGNVKQQKVLRALPVRRSQSKLHPAALQILSIRWKKVVQQLRRKHGTLYTVEQLNCWVHMYQSQKHGSLEFPPNLPYFKATKHKSSSTLKDTAGPSHPSLSSPTCGISPSKRITLRTECMKQLELWHSLLKKGGITKETYDDLQRIILKDIKDNLS